ncbi:Ger(x)C family spore germination protein [Neobacillus sp. YX16]|uniref:Ger(x)C family spore germination protein n=1 Tax=Neobacillus sp. YX16 TaxID=3047874 RepID=UPI0024C40FB5|nr:Ger(x)C family spore germination protein [Neobacillus sp. YX16]WHZ00566.1 Ger(x)C family spore germination protein [Neobacillus sp. YX16]
MNKLFGILIIFLLTGCAEQRIIDDLAMVNAIGYDLTDNETNPIKVTVTFPIITKDGNYDRKTIIVEGKSSKAAKEKVRLKTNFKLESGQMRVSLFGQELAEQGMLPYLHSLVRDASIGTRVMLALAEDDASDILLLQIKNEGQNATYLEQFLTKLNRENVRTNYNMYQFLRDYYDDGIDPILPVFKVEKNNIVYNGIGLFHEDKLVEVLKPSEARYLFLFREEMNKGVFIEQMDVGEKEKVSIMLSYQLKDHQIKVQSTANHQKKASIHIELIGDVIEYSGKEDVSDPKVQKKIENIITKKINQEGKNLILKLQKLQVDPIGINRYVRNSMNYNEWKALNKYQAYQDLNINVEANVILNSSGKWK